MDSPLAVNLTQVYGEHPEVYDGEAQENFLSKGKNPFDLKDFHYVTSVEDSMALNRDSRPHIVLSASGNCLNLVRAVQAARELQMICCGLLGGDGGELAKVADRAVIVPHPSVQRVREEHLFICHVLLELIVRDLVA